MTEGITKGLVDHPLPPDPASPPAGLRDVFSSILENVTRGTASLAQGSGLAGAALLDAVRGVVSSGVRDAIGAGSDLVPGTKAILMGVVRGTGAKGDEALKILSLAAKTVIHQTADGGGNLSAATKGLVLGAIASAKTMGVESAKAASTAAQGALEGAREAGSVTVERVLGALKEPIGGIKVALPEPTRT